MTTFEENYIELIKKVLKEGEVKTGRNGATTSIFGEMIDLGNISEEGNFPMIQGRKMFARGVLGELQAMLNMPKHIDDFTSAGCNFWGKWCKEDGSINIAYGNLWYDFHGFNQMDALRDKLVNNPNDRRLIVTGWDPSNLEDLDLPCCHFLYQFHVSNGDTLNMVWTQRSVDTMIGLPSDAIFAAAWLIILANEVGLKPGNIKMSLGDTHIYHEHLKDAERYVEQAEAMDLPGPKVKFNLEAGKAIEEFSQKDDFTLVDYQHSEAISFELKA